MKLLLVAINILLVLAILGLAFFWHPAPEEMPMPGTQAARMAAEVPPDDMATPTTSATPAEQPVTDIRKTLPTN